MQNEKLVTTSKPPDPVSTGPVRIETQSFAETSLDYETRLVYEVKREIHRRNQRTVDPQTRRVLVILDTATAIAFSRYMADKDDYRPGKLAGDMMR